MSKLLKLLITGALIATAYKVGESIGKDKKIKLPKFTPQDLENGISSLLKGEDKTKSDEEIQQVENYIKELKGKKDKSIKDRDVIGLLEVKLQQLKKSL